MNKYLARLPVRAFIHDNAVRPKKQRYVEQPSCPQHLKQAYSQGRPAYLYGNGIVAAEFVRVEQWRDTGQWVGIYKNRVAGAFRHQTETYVWAKRGNQWVELRQFGVVGQRRFMGFM